MLHCRRSCPRKHNVWRDGNVGRRVARPAKRFHELFESLADSHPQRPAVVTETGVESYAELEQHANRIAETLLDHGVAREEPVAVLTECSADLPATVLGIWKAGAVLFAAGSRTAAGTSGVHGRGFGEPGY